MTLGVPRWFIATLAIVFSVYHVVLAIYSLGFARRIEPVLLALGLYVIATTVSLLPWRRLRLPAVVASFDLAVVVILPILVSTELDPNRAGGNGYAIWYVPAIGTLLAIVSTRHRHSFAWLGIGFLAVQTVLWGGFDALLSTGVIGSASWVAVSHILAAGLARAANDSNRFAVAEREASDWQATQQAHVFERQFRLGQTSDAALPLLRLTVETGGKLSPEQQAECLLAEGAIRDEIRGRRLMNDQVRKAVAAVRRRGVAVVLLDEGELDLVAESALEVARARIASAIAESTSRTITVRTGGRPEEPVVTIVGLAREGAESGAESGDERVDLWLEIPVAVVAR